MANIFQSVKENVTARDAAERYGIKVGKNGMACCPFHDDRHPSMKLDKRFHCFGCQADGDVIDLAARLFGLGNYEAAKKLAEDFGVSYDGGYVKTQQAKRKDPEYKKFFDARDHCVLVLARYLRTLDEWKIHFAPNPADKDWQLYFDEALAMRSRVDYWLEILTEGHLDEQIELMSDIGRKVKDFEGRLEQLDRGTKEESPDSGNDYKRAG